MGSYVAHGGQVNAEGAAKHLLAGFRPGAWNVTVGQRGAGANMSVDVGVGTLDNFGFVLLKTTASIESYGWFDATINATVTAADPSNPRIDIVVAYIDLSLITTSTVNNVGALKFKVVPGTATAGATLANPLGAPSASTIQSSIGAGNPYIAGAPVLVDAGAGNITNAKIGGSFAAMALASSAVWDPVNALVASMIKSSDTGTVTAQMIGPSAITLGSASITSSVASTGAGPNQVTGLTATVTVPAGGRKVKLTMFANNVSTGNTGQNVFLSLWEGAVGTGTQLGQSQLITSGVGICLAEYTPSAGSKTYNVGISGGGGATLTVNAGATTPAILLVEAV